MHSTGPHGAHRRKEDIMTGHIISTCGTIKGQYKAAHGGTQVWYHCKHLGRSEEGWIVSGEVRLKQTFKG